MVDEGTQGHSGNTNARYLAVTSVFGGNQEVPHFQAHLSKLDYQKNISRQSPLRAILQFHTAELSEYDGGSKMLTSSFQEQYLPLHLGPKVLKVLSPCSESTGVRGDSNPYTSKIALCTKSFTSTTWFAQVPDGHQACLTFVCSCLLCHNKRLEVFAPQKLKSHDRQSKVQPAATWLWLLWEHNWSAGMPANCNNRVASSGCVFFSVFRTEEKYSPKIFLHPVLGPLCYLPLLDEKLSFISANIISEVLLYCDPKAHSILDVTCSKAQDYPHCSKK